MKVRWLFENRHGYTSIYVSCHTLLLARAGRQTTVTFQQTQQYFDPLYKRLRQRSVPDELVVGMWMMALAIKERNYLMVSGMYKFGRCLRHMSTLYRTADCDLKLATL